MLKTQRGSTVSRPARKAHPGQHSPKALRLFARCPRSYEHEYLLDISVDEEPSPALVVGQVVHRTLAHLYGLQVGQRTVGAAHAALRDFWREADRSVFGCEEEEAALGRAALGWLSAYCDSSDLTIEPLALEKWVRAKLPRGSRIAGLVDRVDELDDETLEVIDYKTGFNVPSSSALRDDVAAQVYAVAASYTFERPVSAVTHIYLQCGEIVTWELEEAELEDVIRELEDRIATIRSETDFAPVPGEYCKWCKFKAVCDAAPGTNP